MARATTVPVDVELSEIADALDRLATEQEALYGRRMDALLRGRAEGHTAVEMAVWARLRDVTVRQTIRRAEQR